MEPDNELQDLERLLKEACDVPAPHPVFVAALRERLGRELNAAPAAGDRAPAEADKRPAPRPLRRWHWLALPAVAAAAVVLAVGLNHLREPGDGIQPSDPSPVGPPEKPPAAKKTPPPVDVPWKPPAVPVTREEIVKQYGKYFEPEFLKKQAERLDKDKDLNVDALHRVVIRGGVDGTPLGSLFIDKKGDIILASTHPHVVEFSEGLALVGTKVDRMRGHRLSDYGFMDRAGRLVIPGVYKYGLSFREGLAAVQKDKLWGFINRKGEVVVAPRYVRVESFNEGVARAWIDHGTAELIDAKGRSLFRVDGAFSEGLVYANPDIPRVTHRGYFDRDSKRVIAFEEGGLWPLQCEEFHEGRAAVELPGGNWGFIDRDGKLAIPATFKAVSRFSEGLAVVSVGPSRLGPLGYIDPSGKMIIEPGRFLAAGLFQEGLAAVIIPLDEKDPPPAPDPAPGPPRGKWGFIDKTGRVVIPPRFYSVEPFRHGLARVSENPYHVGFIDRSGAYVFQIQEPSAADTKK